MRGAVVSSANVLLNGLMPVPWTLLMAPPSMATVCSSVRSQPAIGRLAVQFDDALQGSAIIIVCRIVPVTAVADPVQGDVVFARAIAIVGLTCVEM